MIDEGGLPGSLAWANSPGWADGEYFAGMIVEPGTDISDLNFFISGDGLIPPEREILLVVPEPSSIVLAAASRGDR